MTREQLQRVVNGVSFGDFRPSFALTVTSKVTSAGEHPAILIGFETVDATASDGERIELYECFAAPDLDDVALAQWIKERCQDVLLHEMDEFFRFRGQMIDKPVHPVSEDVYAHVRKRRDALKLQRDLLDRALRFAAGAHFMRPTHMTVDGKSPLCNDDSALYVSDNSPLAPNGPVTCAECINMMVEKT